MLENKAVYMEMFKNGDYTVFENMLVADFKRLIDWKLNFEKEKKKQMEESLEDAKQQKSNNHRTYKKKQ